MAELILLYHTTVNRKRPISEFGSDVLVSIVLHKAAMGSLYSMVSYFLAYHSNYAPLWLIII